MQGASLLHQFMVNIWRKFNSGQNIWDKSAVLLGASCGTSLGTWGTQQEHMGKKREIPPTLLKPKRKNTWPFWVHVKPSHWPHDNYGCKTTYLSPFSAWAKYLCMTVWVPWAMGTTIQALTYPIHFSYWLDEVPPNFPPFFKCNDPIWLVRHSQKKKKSTEAPHNRRLYFEV